MNVPDGETIPPQDVQKGAFQRGRSQRRGEAYSFLYVESLSAARTKLEDFFNILLIAVELPPMIARCRSACSAAFDPGSHSTPSW